MVTSDSMICTTRTRYIENDSVHGLLPSTGLELETTGGNPLRPQPLNPALFLKTPRKPKRMKSRA
eukprot:829018-Amphidinium_carterae.1